MRWGEAKETHIKMEERKKRERTEEEKETEKQRWKEDYRMALREGGRRMEKGGDVKPREEEREKTKGKATGLGDGGKHWKR